MNASTTNAFFLPVVAAQESELEAGALVTVEDGRVNRSVALYRNYQRLQPRKTEFPPALALMTAFAAESITGLRNVGAVGHEPPALTAVVETRRILNRPLRTLGVVYRKPLESFVREQATLAKIESVHFEAVEVGVHPSHNDVEWALDQLVGEGAIDALWVLNDNVLLSPELLREVWLPTLHRNHLPVIVGVDSLVRPELDFGSLAVTPDLELLGVQAANLLLDLQDDDWQLEPALYQPVSVRTLVNASQARKYFGLTDKGLSHADGIME